MTIKAAKEKTAVTPLEKEKTGSGGLRGAWSEPPAPPPATAYLPLDGSVAPQVAALLLKANIPATVTLKGPADLLFSAFTLSVTAKPLVRNMALETWGTSRSIVEDGDYLEFLLPGLTRMEGVGARDRAKSSDTTILVKSKDGGQFKETGTIQLFTQPGVGKPASGYNQVAFQTDAVRIDRTANSVHVLLHSTSFPSRIGVAVGDDTPVQVFPSMMENNGTLTTRDLAGQMNAAWRRFAAGGQSEVRLKLTSLTDGVVSLDFKGSWKRAYFSPATTLTLNPFQPATFTAPWPFGPATAEADAVLQLTGRLDGGKRLRLAGSAADFCVRVTEKLEVAQAILLAVGTATAEARQVAAVWLCLPAVPGAEEKVELRLAGAVGDPPAPADEAVARVEVTLPADASAYQPEGGRFWFRAPFPAPVTLDGTAVLKPFFVVAAGRTAGTVLSHRLGGALSSGRVASLALHTGAALFRNLERTGAWDLQPYNRQAATWVMDLELLPLAAEYDSLARVTFAGQPAAALAFTGAGDGVITYATKLSRPPGDVTVSVQSDVNGAVTAQLAMYKTIKL